ncbi:MAG: GNAT family N-acetyltransferase [Phycisphaerales bacterium]
MIEYLRIDREHPLYEQEVALRQSVLLDPINYNMQMFEEEFPGFEERFEHFIAVVDHPKGKRVIGCALLLPHFPDDEPSTGKLMQMAVDPQRQREGIGRRLVIELERRALGELGLTKLYCHARADAAVFYASLGWVRTGDPFFEAGIEHFKMVFDTSDITSASTSQFEPDPIEPV